MRLLRMCRITIEVLHQEKKNSNRLNTGDIDIGDAIILKARDIFTLLQKQKRKQRARENSERKYIITDSVRMPLRIFIANYLTLLRLFRQRMHRILKRVLLGEALEV